MDIFSASNQQSKSLISVPFLRLRVKTWAAVLAFGVIGFVVPMIYGYLNGFPVANVQDELSYEVAADTYASGRLTNPTPAFFEHFETSHVLMEPSYISKYPPLQGMFMAAGKIVFGHQIFGVWLSCGLLAAALFWMLLIWTRPNWAFAGTLLMILFLGIDTYWAQSYWGGMIAASGGALFFGGLRRIFKNPTVFHSILMMIGGVILVNSRPFEGTVTMLPSLLVLLVWILRRNNYPLSLKLAKVVLPGIVVAGIGLSAMCYQYYRVTGSPFTLPYAVHHAQYYPTPLFSFQPVNHSATRGNPRIRRIYDQYTKPPILETMLDTGLPDSVVLRSVYGFIYLAYAIPFFLFSPVLLILFYFTLPLVIRRSKWLLLIAATIIFTFACVCLGVWWDQYHYTAPLTSCFFLLLCEELRQFYHSSKKGAQRRKIAVTLIALVIGSAAYLQLFSYRQPQMKEDFSTERILLTEVLAGKTAAKIEVPVRATFFKAELERLAEKLPDRYIAVVKYDPEFDFHDEIVFNRADIENAPLIWAHDLGEEKNKALLAHYNNRKILAVNLKGSEIEIKPLP